jgi:hypothetical protein
MDIAARVSARAGGPRQRIRALTAPGCIGCPAAASCATNSASKRHTARRGSGSA